MKKALKKLIAALLQWERATDAEFAAKDDAEKQVYLEIINDWR
jgi:hypothetical protein